MNADQKELGLRQGWGMGPGGGAGGKGGGGEGAKWRGRPHAKIDVDTIRWQGALIVLLYCYK